MLAPYTIFGKTLLIPIVTYTNGEKDTPPKTSWDKDIWIEVEEDWYAFLNPSYKNYTVRVIERTAWLKAYHK